MPLLEAAVASGPVRSPKAAGPVGMPGSRVKAWQGLRRTAVVGHVLRRALLPARSEAQPKLLPPTVRVGMERARPVLAWVAPGGCLLLQGAAVTVENARENVPVRVRVLLEPAPRFRLAPEVLGERSAQIEEEY